MLRELWNSLLACAPLRKKTIEHEARWWNLAGFFLRPGFGFPLDDFRIKELWKIILSDLKNPKPQETLIQLWICFRRIAGGLNKGQQMQLAGELASDIFDKKTGRIEIARKGDLYPYSEKIRALASFERLELPFKIRMGDALVERIVKGSPSTYDFWALGRHRSPPSFYGSAGQVIPRDICTKWVEKLLAHKPAAENQEAMIFLLRQLARKTDHRELNLGESTIQKILDAYLQSDLKEWLLEERILTQTEQEQVFGDQLPSGLILDISSL